MNLRKFFLYSFLVHAVFVAAMFFIVPAQKEKKSGGEFLADLVSPEKVPSSKPLIPPPPPRVRSVPLRRQRSVAPVPPAIKNREVRTEKGSAHEEVSKFSGVTRDTKTMPPSHESSKGGVSGESRTGPSTGGGSQKPERAESTLKEKLFDRDVIGDLAKRNIEKEDKKERSFTFDVKDYKFLIYNRRLKERIESIWHYPPEAAARGIYGDLIIRFTIKKNGHLGAVELVRTSGHKNLDDAAIEALREGDPFWPLPEEWGMEAYTIEGHFIYSLYGYYIR